MTEAGADILNGHAGDDVFYIGPGDAADGGTNAIGGFDYAYIDLSSLTGSSTVSLSSGRSATFAGSTSITNIERGTLSLGNGNDAVTVTSGIWLLNLGFGDDFAQGGVAADTMNGEAGNDTLKGGDGDDLLSGNDGNNFLYGEAGNDTRTSGVGSDYIDGRAGNDTIEAGEGADTVLGGDGNDYIVGGLGADTLTGGRVTTYSRSDLAFPGPTVRPPPPTSSLTSRARASQAGQNRSARILQHPPARV